MLGATNFHHHCIVSNPSKPGFIVVCTSVIHCLSSMEALIERVFCHSQFLLQMFGLVTREALQHFPCQQCDTISLSKRLKASVLKRLRSGQWSCSFCGLAWGPSKCTYLEDVQHRHVSGALHCPLTEVLTPLWSGKACLLLEVDASVATTWDR